MSWQEVSTMSLRQEFVTLATAEGANIRQLCRCFQISPRTAYKWLHRYHADGVAGLQNRSRRPHHSPIRTAPAVEHAVLAVRTQHPAWGGRKIRAWLHDHGHRVVPSASTITAILRRHGVLDPAESRKHRPWQRFEHAAPNHLWQMDFKGHFARARGRCHPLTVLDDHSRFCVGLAACADERGETVQAWLTAICQRYGLPARMVMDNGSPWGSDRAHRWTPLTAWLLRLGIGVSHGRPYHPQTPGKDERLHRTLQAEVLRDRAVSELAACQAEFARWRTVYNLERPHEALGLVPPARRYRVSPRPFPETLPPIEYGPDDLVRKVQIGGVIYLQGHRYRIARAFRGYPVALRPTAEDHSRAVYFGHHRIATLDLTQPQGSGPES